MLTAITEAGKRLCLAHAVKKEALKILRKKEKFFCPVCGEGVLLKLGNHRIPHFSHKKGNNCTGIHEKESIYHMEGKLQLYQWLISQDIPAELEFYDREIKQRPDIMFRYNGKKYALEYQCSVIPEPEFIKRTNTYINQHYEPIWIIGGKQFSQKNEKIVTLSHFHYLFIRENEKGLVYIPSYCPETRLFHFIDSIYPYSPQKAMAHHSFISPSKLKIAGLLTPKVSSSIPIRYWAAVTEKYNLQWSMHPTPCQDSFLKEIYKHSLNLYLLPPEIGLPVRHSILIQTPPIIWQAYIFMDILLGKKSSQLIPLNDIRMAVKRRVRRNEIIPRKLPGYPETGYFKAVIEYLSLLEQLGIISRKGDGFIQMKKGVMIPASNREKAEKNSSFFKGNLKILSKL